MKNIYALLAGLIFGLGLIVSGMANPEKVIGFLNIFAGKGFTMRIKTCDSYTWFKT